LTARRMIWKIGGQPSRQVSSCLVHYLSAKSTCLSVSSEDNVGDWFFDGSLLPAQRSHVRSAERANRIEEFIVEGSVLESFALEPVDKISIASRQTSEGSENDLCDQGVCRLSRSGDRSKGSVCLLDALRQLANRGHESVVVMIRAEVRVPKRSEAWLRDQIYDPSMHGVRMPEQETRSAIHSPTGQVESQLKSCMITIGNEPFRSGTSEITVTVLPRAVSVMLVCRVTIVGLDTLMNAHLPLTHGNSVSIVHLVLTSVR